ncbi:MAG: elongation factor G, partial [Bdellovibrionales bacterium]|nr:elongation factor G [Bdellovibrionales bacterium]
DNRSQPTQIPKEYLPIIESGFHEAMDNGVLAGYQMMGVKARLVGGSFHETDSNEVAFKIAASIAFKEAAKSCEPKLLEPYARLEVTTPEEFMGNIIGDMNSRRGKVLHIDPVRKAQVIQIEVPVASMFGYATELRSQSQGRASFSMQPSHYAPVPPKVQQEILVRLGRI